jgi:hypothetical protein
LRYATWAVAVILGLTLPLIAHGGFDHVNGTVVKVERNIVTVKTAKGEVVVKLGEKTEITKNDLKAEISELKPGARVVIDIPEGNKEMLAHSVKVGVSSATPHTHEEHH